MTQLIDCRFARYALPVTAGWWKRFWFPVCEQLKLPCFRGEMAFSITTDSPEMFLDAGRPFTVHGPLLGGNEGNDDVEILPLKWTVGYRDAGNVRIQMVAKELRSSPLNRWFARWSDTAQVTAAFLIVEAIALVIGFGIYVVLAYPEPAWFWGGVARNIRTTVGIGLPVLILAAGVWLQNQYEGEVFRQRLAFALTAFSWPLAALAWLLWGAPPMTTESYTEYLAALRSNAAAVSTIFVSLSPWLVIILKALGLDLLASGAKRGSEQIESLKIKQ